MLFESDKKILGKNIKKYRKYKKLTQFELAEKIGLNEKQIYRIESGLNYPTYLTFIKLVEILDINFDDIKKDSQSPQDFEVEQINKILKHSSDKELKLYLDILKTLKKNIKSFK